MRIEVGSDGWGSGVIPRLSRDLRSELPGIKGFSETNFNRTIRFYREYPALTPNLPQAVANLDRAGGSKEVPRPVESPSIGLIQCQDKKKILAEYALRGMNKPIGVSEYVQTRALPETLKSALPRIEEIEEELSG